MYSLLGPWHKVGKQRAFRFYIRERQATGEKFYFADYHIGNLTSRHHLLGKMDNSHEANLRKANKACLDMTQDELAELEG